MVLHALGRTRSGTAVLVLALAGCTVGRPASTPAVSARPAPASAPAPTGTPAVVAGCAPTAARCDGTLRVPLNHAAPAEGTTTVDFRVTRRKDPRAPYAGTVVGLIGGPGPGVDTVDEWRAALGGILRNHDLVTVNYRGFARADRKDCPSVSYDGDAPLTEIDACLRRHGAAVVRHITAANAARDLELLRLRLELGAVDVMGQSYGTMMAQVYATLYPSSVRSMVLDSPVTVDESFYLDRMPTDIAGLRELCADSAACRAVTPEPAAAWSAAAQAARAGRIPGVSAADLADVTGWGVLLPAFQRDLVAAVRAALVGDPAPLQRARTLVTSTVARLGTAIEEGTGLPGAGADIAYHCADFQQGFDWAADLPERLRQVTRSLQQDPDFHPFTADEYTARFRGTGGGRYDRWCTRWAPPAETNPVLTAPAPPVPTLIVTGSFDAPRTAATIARRLPGAHALVAPFGGHWLSPGNACVAGFVQQFLRAASPAGIPASACAAPHPATVGAFPRVAADLPDGPRAGPDRTATAARATARDLAAYAAALVETDLTSVPTLRGGTATVVSRDATSLTVRLKAVRFVADVPVDGRLRVTADGGARGTVTARSPSGRRVTLSVGAGAVAGG